MASFLLSPIWTNLMIAVNNDDGQGEYGNISVLVHDHNISVSF